MKKLLPLIPSLFLLSGCVMAFNNEKTGRSWLVSTASRTKLQGFVAGTRTNGTGGIALEKFGTEAQSELVEAAAEGTAKGAIGRR